MTKEMIEKEIGDNTQNSRRYFTKFHQAGFQTFTQVAELFGKPTWQLGEDGRWRITYDPKYGGKPSLIHILRSFKR